MSEAPQAEVFKVQAAVTTMAALTDRQDWNGLQSVFADQVLVDYTSLWGGQAELMDRGDLIAAWRGLVPGFDATRHRLGDINAVVTGQSASATAPIHGTHLLDGQTWVVAGRYEVKLILGESWRISGLALVAESEEGDRALTEEARHRVGEGQK